MADKTIGELPAVPIGELPVAPDIYDDTFIPVEQQGEARHITGSQWKGYATAAVASQIGEAESAAQEAKTARDEAAKSQTAAAQSAQEAAASQEAAKGSADAAKTSEAAVEKSAQDAAGSAASAVESAEAAEASAQTAASAAETAAKDAAEKAVTEAETLLEGYVTDSGANKDAAEKSAQAAAASQAAALESETAAGESATAAAQSASDAETAKTGAETALASAETAKDAAASSATSAAGSATEAAESAQTAKDYSGKPPVIGEDENWETWDAELGEYVTTGKPSRGAKGDKGDKGDPGKDGTGTGDMLASVYDPQSKATDVFQYVDDAVASAVPAGDFLPVESPVFTGTLSTKYTQEAPYVTYNCKLEIGEYGIRFFGNDECYMKINVDENNAYINHLRLDEDKGENRTRIYGVATPLFDEDAANKKYVDESIQQAILDSADRQNLLDNARWDKLAYIVNQRGVSGEISQAGYFIDRWKLVDGSVTVQEGGLVLDGKMAQILEFDPGGSVTASVLTTTGLGTAEYSAEAKTFTITGTGETLLAVKLELGDHQTLAHQDADGNWVLNDPPPNYQQELAKCQRYQNVFNVYQAPWAYIGIGQAQNEKWATILVPLTNTLRAKPTISYSGKFLINHLGASGITATRISVDNISSSNVAINVYADSGLIKGDTYFLTTNNDKTANIIIDANL